VLHLAEHCAGNVGEVIHELLHVLGFYHEHQRRDRNSYITVYEDNILTGEGTVQCSTPSSNQYTVLYLVLQIWYMQYTVFWILCSVCGIRHTVYGIQNTVGQKKYTVQSSSF